MGAGRLDGFGDGGGGGWMVLREGGVDGLHYTNTMHAPHSPYKRKEKKYGYVGYVKKN